MLNEKLNEMLKEYSSILDIGCGDGRNFNPTSGIYVGIDGNNRILSYKPETINFLMDYDFSDGNIPFLDKTFDVVLLIDVIEHLEKDKAVLLLKEAERIARERIIIYTPDGFLEQNEEEGKKRDPTFDEKDIHRCGFDRQELENMGYVIEVFPGDDVHNREYHALFGVKDLKLRISVVIPVYNQKPEYFQKAIESVINQTFKPYEIIIVDDGCEPPQNIILPDAKGIKVNLIRNIKNMGIGFSRQIGADAATGAYIAYLSSDDIWDKNFLEVMSAEAEKHPDKILFSSYFFIDGEDNIVSSSDVPSFENHEDFCIASWDAAEKNTMFVNFSTVFIPKKVFEKVKFDENLRFCEDLDFLLRSMKHFKYHPVNQPLLKYRTAGNLTGRILDKIPKQNIMIREKCREYWKNE